MTHRPIPNLFTEPDDDGEPDPSTLATGWDVSFGCRINFGPGPDGVMRVIVHVSDSARRNGVAVLDCPSKDLRLLARQLLEVADTYDERAVPTGDL